VLGDLRQFEKMSEAGENKVPSWDEIFVDTMDNPSADVSTPEALEVLLSIQAKQQETKAQCESNLERVKAAISKIEEKIAAKDKKPEPKVEAA